MAKVEKQKSKVWEMNEIIDELSRLSAKGLISRAKEQFNVDLSSNIGNGRAWLQKKVAYLEQERLMGTTEMSADNAKKLEDPKVIKEMKEDEEKEIMSKKERKPKPAKSHEKLDRVRVLLKEKKDKTKISKIMTQEYGEKTGNPKNIAVYIYRIKHE